MHAGRQPDGGDEPTSGASTSASLAMELLLEERMSSFFSCHTCSRGEPRRYYKGGGLSWGRRISCFDSCHT